MLYDNFQTGEKAHFCGVKELNLDTITLQSSECGNLTMMFPLVTKCVVTFSCKVSSEIIRQVNLPGLKELKLQSTPNSGHCPVTEDFRDLCRVIRESFQGLEQLSFEKLGIGNSQVETILQSISRFYNSSGMLIR